MQACRDTYARVGCLSAFIFEFNVLLSNRYVVWASTTLSQCHSLGYASLIELR